ncbi:MAG: MBL fold metallo-hydrolase [bacterium]
MRKLRMDQENSLTVIYEGFSLCRPVGRTHWGYSVAVNFRGKRFLVDFGKDADIFMNNLKAYGFRPEEFDFVLETSDELGHRGGINRFLTASPKIPVYTSARYVKNNILKENPEAKVTVIDSYKEISPDIWLFTTYHKFTKSRYGEEVWETSVILKTERGLVLIFGCSLPGSTIMLKAIKKVFPEKIYLLTGGLHMVDYDAAKIKQKAMEFKKRGVENIAPNHCSGPLTGDIFKSVFGVDYLPVALGSEIPLPSSLTEITDRS